MTTTMSAEEMERERAEFERIIADHHEAADLSRKADGSYSNYYLECVWQGWVERARHPQPECGKGLEVRGLQWLDTGHYRKKPPQFGYSPHDWNELCLVSDAQRQIDEHKRLLAERDARIEALTEYAAAVEKSADKAEQERDQLRAKLDDPDYPPKHSRRLIAQLRARVGELEHAVGVALNAGRGTSGRIIIEADGESALRSTLNPPQANSQEPRT